MNDRRGQMIATSVGATTHGPRLRHRDPRRSGQRRTRRCRDAERNTANNWIDNTLRSPAERPGEGSDRADHAASARTGSHRLSCWSRNPASGLTSASRLRPRRTRPGSSRSPGRVVQRRAGDILMPERFTPDTVEQLKGRRLSWSGQYQQRPAPLGGNLIKRSEVRYYGGIDPRTGQPDERLPETLRPEADLGRLLRSRTRPRRITWRSESSASRAASAMS